MWFWFALALAVELDPDALLLIVFDVSHQRLSFFLGQKTRSKVGEGTVETRLEKKLTGKANCLKNHELHSP